MKVLKEKLGRYINIYTTQEPYLQTPVPEHTPKLPSKKLPIKADARQKVLDALRAAGRTQIVGRMRGPDKYSDCFCVNGVICDVLDPKGWRPYKAAADEGMLVTSYEVGGYLYSPKVITSLLGDFPTHEARNHYDALAQHLVEMNDSGEWSLPQLADFFESKTCPMKETP